MEMNMETTVAMNMKMKVGRVKGGAYGNFIRPMQL